MKKVVQISILLGLFGFASQSHAAKAPEARTDRILVQPKAGAERALLKLHKEKGLKIKKKFEALRGLEVLEGAEHQDIAALLETYNQSGLVEFAEPDYKVYPTALPNDPSFSKLWALNNIGQTGGKVNADMNAPEAWQSLKSAEKILVAVIDTGVRSTHQDLAANMWKNPGEVKNGVDDDRNGVIDDIHGYNALDNNGNPVDLDGHGTHVAGTIGAVGNNGIGITGVAWKVQIMACKFLGTEGGSVSDAIDSIQYAVRMGARVINASWGGAGYSSALRSTISSARDAGVIFVAAAGNSRENNDVAPHYPASYPVENIVAVAATTHLDALDANYSNYGASTVDLAAPGTSIHSTWHTSDSAYNTISGTSMATPHVTGAVALALAAFPNESYTKTISRIFSATDKLPSLNGKTVTGGRLNLAKLFPPRWTVTTAAQGNGSVTLSPQQATFADGSTVQLTAAAATGNRFVGWTGSINSTENPLSVLVKTNLAMTAKFAAVWNVTLQPGTGGVASLVTAGGPEYLHGTQVSVKAQAQSGYEFAGWTGSIASTANPLTFSITAPTSLTPTFRKLSSQKVSFQGVKMTTGGQLTFQVDGADSGVRLESSTDLKTWTAVEMPQSSSSTGSVTVQSGQEPKRFFRMVVAQ